MITKILALKNIGAFENWEWPHDSAPGRLDSCGSVTVIAGGNGKGKTTIAAVFRSLQDDDPNPVLERRRQCSGGGFEGFLAKVEHDGGNACLSGESGWNGDRPKLVVFDDVFVSRNVHEGLSVGGDQREALHELVVGEDGVREALKAESVAKESADLKRRQRTLANELSQGLRHLTLERVLREAPPNDIDAALATLAQELKLALQAAPIRALPEFVAMPRLPEVPVETIRELLGTTVEQVEESAQQRVLDHLANLEPGGDAWVHAGIELVAKRDHEKCPFCAQELGEAARTLISAYRAHFNNQYQALQSQCVAAAEQIRRLIPETLPESLRVAHERQVEAHRQWVVHLPDLPQPPLLPDVGAVGAARRGLLDVLETKRLAPLSVPVLSEETVRALEDWRRLASEFARVSAAGPELQQRTQNLRSASAALDEAGLKRKQAELEEWKSVGMPEFQRRLSEYRSGAITIAQKEKDFETAKAALKKYQDSQFPTFRNSVNDYLSAFATTFALADLSKTKGVRGGERKVDYALQAASTTVHASSKVVPGRPHFGSLLSAGDRRALAFAFFLATLKGRSLEGTTIVCDDPTTSLDVDRRSRTVMELVELAKRGAQLIVLSHFEPLLLELAARVERLTSSDQNSRLTLTCLKIDGAKHKSRLVSHRLERQSRLVRHRNAVREFVEGRALDPTSIGNDCRKLLEGIAQVCFPDQYPPGGCLKDFCERVVPLLDQGKLDGPTFDELRKLRDFFNPESHFQPNQGPTPDELRANAERLLRLAQLRLGTLTA